jgi:apolipoprotein N-acyltransferase
MAPGIAVVLVQGNIPQGRKWDPASARATFEHYLEMSHDGVTEAHRAFPLVTPVVVWPETASPFLLDQDPAARGAIMDASRIGLDTMPVLAGSVRFDAERRPRNSLMALVGFGPPAAIYDKWHLVPFGEYQPSWFPLPIQVVPGGGFASGAGPSTLHVPGVPAFGPLICYEAIFPGQVVDRADRPAWLVNVTNDAWFGNSAGPRQHLAAARMRAVEEGLPVMRAANTGISAGFDAFGHLVGRVSMNVTGISVILLPAALPPTLFARFGLPIPAALALLTLSAGLSVKFRKRAKN